MKCSQTLWLPPRTGEFQPPFNCALTHTHTYTHRWIVLEHRVSCHVQVVGFVAVFFPAMI